MHSPRLWNQSADSVIGCDMVVTASPARPRKAGSEPQKMEFGPWIFSAFKVMAKLKGLCGGLFDIFGKTAERRLERRLIGEYREMIEAVLPRLSPGTHAQITAIAELPDMIKGYGHIKEENAALYEAKKVKLIAALKEPLLAAA